MAIINPDNPVIGLLAAKSWYLGVAKQRCCNVRCISEASKLHLFLLSCENSFIHTVVVIYQLNQPPFL